MFPCDPLGAEKCDCDFPVRRAPTSAIGCLHHLPDASTLVGGDAPIRRNRPPVDGVPEAKHGLKPLGHVVVEGKKHG